ncbi:hypothetical protein GEMRC1_001509 [Eukaryota sp. GEM-RC1]
MFIVTTIKDCVAIEPHKFGEKLDIAIEDSINSRYSGKVLSDHGICISMWELMDMSDPFIFPGKGESYTWVTFKMLLWQPMVGEIVSGKVLSCSKEEGITVSLGFYDELIVPPTQMMPNTSFDDIDNLWTWAYTEDYDLPIDIDHSIATRITDVTYPLAKPKIKPDPKKQLEVDQEEEETPSAIRVVASIAETGLGMKDWWTNSEE